MIGKAAPLLGTFVLAYVLAVVLYSASPVSAPLGVPPWKRTPTPTPFRSSTPTPFSAPSPTPTAPASPSPVIATPSPTTMPAARLYGLVGQGGLGQPIDTARLSAQYQSGVRLRMLELGWDVLQPNGPSDWNTNAAAQFQARIDAFVSQGPDVQIVLDLGLQYQNNWIKSVSPLVDQHGAVWQGGFGQGGANVYWSPTVRQYVASYIQKIFQNLNFRGRLWAVRVGPSGGELLYPEKTNPDFSQSFWAYDPNAQSLSPVPGWRPGDPSPNGEAGTFYYWYVDNLALTFNWFEGEIHRYFAGYVAPVTPGSGVWDGTADTLISQNLVISGWGYYGTGNYWQRLYSRLSTDRVLNWCSSLGDGTGSDQSPNWWEWSSGKQMAYLARLSGRPIYGENPGANPYDTSGGADVRTTAQWLFRTAAEQGYMGLIWVNQSYMDNSSYTSLSQYASLVSTYR